MKPLSALPALESLSRRDFLRLLSASGATIALAPTLAACAPSAYSERAHATWEQPLKKEPSVSSQLREIVRYATLAPSGHNTQPWQFAIQDNSVRIFPDYNRQLPVVDPNHRELFISLGCALENLVIAAASAGYSADVAYFPENEPECLRVTLAAAPSATQHPLFAAIPVRQCTRSEYDGKPVPAAGLEKLAGSVAGPGIVTHLFPTPAEFEPLIEYVKEGDKRQFADKAFVQELVEWIRFNDAEATKTMDGLFSRCSGNPTVPRWFGQLFMSLSGIDAQAKTDEKMVRSSSGMMMFAAERDDKRSWVVTGRAFERFALTATSLGIKVAFMNQPAEVPELRSQVQSHLNLNAASPQLLVRFGYAQPMPRSLRRPVEQVL